jgi:hypothetical protein
MDNNLFSDEQIELLYNDRGFLSFVNQYFSSFSTKIQNMDYSVDNNRAADIDTEIYLRIVLANISNLYDSICDLEKCLSVSQVEREYVFSGAIQGRLNVGKYTKRLAQSRFPKEYPCVIKSRSYVQPENIYVIFIINSILKLLDQFKIFLFHTNGSDITELDLINHYAMVFKSFSLKAYFRECQDLANRIIKSYGGEFPEYLRNLIFNRIHKGKIRNAHIYQSIFNWYNTYKKGSTLEASSLKIKILRYSDDFANRLFELWCLYNIKATFIDSFNAVDIEENNVMSQGDGYVFKLSVPTGGIIELFYQKGANLYWKTDDDLIWKYYKDGRAQGLRGIPDISIRYTAKEDSLIMVDIKNRVRESGSNSEEIYKMIGYFSNFKNAFEKRFSPHVKKQGALIFRNDYSANEEYLESDDGYRLITLSAGVSKDSRLNKDQFKKLCKYALDVQGIDGTTAELMGSFNQAQKKMGSAINVGSEDYIYELTEKNHSTIEQLFSNSELEKQLPAFKERLCTDHFPHIWTRLSDKTKDILGMAECLYKGVNNCESADYAPICLEYCRALEVEINEIIFTPFRKSHNVDQLANRNYYYEKLKQPREMTLGECVFLLDKCSHRYHPLTELRDQIRTDIKKSDLLLNKSVSILRNLNENIRRLSAHTSVMTYNDLILTRQTVLGIGNLNIFYVLRDDR